MEVVCGFETFTCLPSLQTHTATYPRKTRYICSLRSRKICIVGVYGLADSGGTERGTLNVEMNCLVSYYCVSSSGVGVGGGVGGGGGGGDGGGIV